MIKHTSTSIIATALEQTGLTDCFDAAQPELAVFEYEKNEIIMSPMTEESNLLFLCSGGISLYILSEDGRLTTVALISSRCLLGDLELFSDTPTANETIYVEATTPVRMLAVPFPLCRRELQTNIPFLNAIIRYLNLKNRRQNQIPPTATSLNDKFIFYIRHLCPDQTLYSVETAAQTLHCSCRQLQRILKKLTESGDLCRLGKGIYRWDREES